MKSRQGKLRRDTYREIEREKQKKVKAGGEEVLVVRLGILSELQGPHLTTPPPLQRLENAPRPMIGLAGLSHLLGGGGVSYMADT